MRDFYTYISDLAAHGFRCLGTGAYSRVYGFPGSDRVVKVNRCADGWLDYVLWAQREGYAGTFAPRVFSYKRFADGSYVAVVERMADSMADLYGSQVYNDWLEGPHLVARQRADDEDVERAERAFPGITHFLDLLSQRFDFLDCHAGNWMLRADGSLCFTDPVCGTADNGKTTPTRMRSHDFQQLAA